MSLCIVPTPIGNLKDMTLRGLEVLQTADLILCEDTRTSSILLQHYNIKKKLQAFHQHNEHLITPKIVEQILQKNMRVAMISDAGTPGISDPCFLLIRACIQANIQTECLPGATAFVPALVNSGIASNKFVFEGFLPMKKGRQSLIEKLAQEERTIILYESPKKILHTIEDLLQHFEQNRKAVICRELSKLHESFLRDTLGQLKTQLEAKELKGEIVLVIAGKER